MTSLRQPTGMAGFTIIWLGQLLSTAGTRMINFALAIWVWQQTGRASDLALMTLLAFAATVVVSPAAGSLIDRWSRRTSIIMSDVGAAVAAAGALVLFATGTASFWSLIVVNTVSGAFLAFQYPAYSTLVTSMLPEEGYSRANAMISMVRSIPAVFAPGIAGVLMAFSGIWFILVISLICYAVAIATVFLVALPAREEQDAAGDAGGSSMWQDSLFGFRYMAARPGFLGMQAILFVVGMVSAMGFILLTPLVLIQTGNDEAQLGAVNSVGAVGGVLGGLLVGMLKPPAHKVIRVLLGIVVFSLFGRVLMSAGDGFVIWAVAWFVSWMSVPFIEAYSQTLWQERIALAVQGRVFAAMQSLSQLALLIGFAVTGTLVDRVFEPAARDGSGIASWFTPLVGSAPGAGMKLVFLLSGVLGVAAAIYGVLAPSIRALDTRTHDDEDDESIAAPIVPDSPLPFAEERSTHDDKRAAVPGSGE